MDTVSVFSMSGAGLAQCEFRKQSRCDQFQIFLNSPFHCPVSFDSRGYKFLKRAAAYTADSHSIHFVSPKRGQRAALPVQMVHILIGNRFHCIVFSFDNGEKTGCSEMIIHPAFSIPVFIGGKSRCQAISSDIFLICPIFYTKSV